MRVHFLAAALLSLAACSDNRIEEPNMTTDSDLEIATLQGALAGEWADESDGIRVFLGIPYAAPPVGELRWRPPQRPRPWQGIRPADQAGAACWQNINEENFVWARGDFERSEDCLYLNIWSSVADTSAPVMVWFHGGSHTAGMGHDRIFDGTELARMGVVVVTINYRLGPFGFLAHPALAEESDHDSAGNYGLMDKIAALNWVRDNIAQFNGDADNVTIFGQSAGSQSVCALLASPLARGLFHKAIGQSASCLNSIGSADPHGLERGTALVDALGAGDDLAAMRAATPEQIRAAAAATNWEQASRIVVDGWVLPSPPIEIFAQREQAPVPLLVGSLSNEGNQLLPLNEQLSLDELRTYAQSTAGEHGTELLKLYQAELAISPALAQREISTDLFLTYGMRSWASLQHAAGHPTYLYYMDHNPPAFRLYVPERPDLQLVGGPRGAGAYHSGDLAYVFANTAKVGMDWNDEDHAFARQVAGYWTNFARSGDPNGEGLPHWARYDTASRNTMVLREGASQTVSGVRTAVMDLWDARYGR